MKEKNIPVIMMISVLAAYVVTAIMLLILSFMVYKNNISDLLLSAGLVMTYVLSNVIGGFVAGRQIKRKRAIIGLVCGILYIVIFVGTGGIIGANTTMKGVFLPLILSVNSSIIGAVLS